MEAILFPPEPPVSTSTPSTIPEVFVAVTDIIGPSGVILPMGDPNFESFDTTTFTTADGGGAFGFTYSESRDNWDTALDSVGTLNIPAITFNGSNEQADTPDSTFWSNGDGTNDSAFSFGFWLNIPDTGALRTVMAKWETTGGKREWRFYITGNETVHVDFKDEGTPGGPALDSGSSITADTWTFIVFTYDGTGGSTAATGMNLYIDGSADSSNRSNSATYVAMHNGPGVFAVGEDDGTSRRFDGIMLGGPLGPFFTHQELTADEVTSLFDLGSAVAGLP